MAVSRRRTSSDSKPKAKRTAKAARGAPARGGGRTGRARSPLDRDDAIALAQTLTASRQQFAQAFRQAQRGRRTVVEFEAVASALADNISAFGRAFQRAAENGWLVELCVACIDARLTSSGFTAIAADATQDRELAKLQQIVDADRGLQDPEVLAARLPAACRQVCQIEIDTVARGTGFLIRSDLVMTAYHVIRQLLEADNTQTPGTGPRLRVRFDYSRRVAQNGQITVNEGFTCPAADSWLVATSPCTTDEALNRLPADEEQLNNYWDFAVIRLAESPTARPGLKIGRQPVRRGHRLTILQHPNQRPVAYDFGTVRRFLGSGAFRIVHRVNTDGGSSGSPCLNDAFEVVCLHQAEMPAPPRRARAPRLSDDDKENRAVPMPRILAVWNPDADAPRATPFRRLLTVDTTALPAHPLFGRVSLQEWIQRASASAASENTSRFLTVAGSSGSGKSFTMDVLRAMLRAADHSIVACKASDWTSETTALGLVDKYLATAAWRFVGPIAAARTVEYVRQRLVELPVRRRPSERDRSGAQGSDGVARARRSGSRRPAGPGTDQEVAGSAVHQGRADTLAAIRSVGTGSGARPWDRAAHGT